MNTRITQIRKNADLSMEKFGEKIGLGRSAVSRIESGCNGPSDSVIKMICSMFRVNETWLRTGEGDMYVNLSPMDEALERLAAIRMVISYGSDKHAVEVAKFKERLAAAILNLNDEGCDLMIKFIEDMGYVKKEEND